MTIEVQDLFIGVPAQFKCGYTRQTEEVGSKHETFKFQGICINLLQMLAQTPTYMANNIFSWPDLRRSIRSR